MKCIFSKSNSIKFLKQKYAKHIKSSQLNNWQHSKWKEDISRADSKGLELFLKRWYKLLVRSANGSNIVVLSHLNFMVCEVVKLADLKIQFKITFIISMTYTDDVMSSKIVIYELQIIFDMGRCYKI